MASLESQVSSLRDEMAAVYKTQGQNAQRLLAMNETLREKEEAARIEAEHLRRATDELNVLRSKVDQHNELMTEKERAMQVCIPPNTSNIYRSPLRLSARFCMMNLRLLSSSWVSCRSATSRS